MDLVTIFLLCAFQFTVYSRDPGKLTGKMPIFNQNPSLQKVVINARGGIQGIGVSTFGGTVLVHDSIIKDTETCSIIFSYIGIKLNASRFITHDDIVLLKLNLEGTNIKLKNIPYAKVAWNASLSSPKIRKMGWNIKKKSINEGNNMLRYHEANVEIQGMDSGIINATRGRYDKIGDLLFTEREVLGILVKASFSTRMYADLRNLGEITAHLQNEISEVKEEQICKLCMVL